jgi:hypothetical protein
MLMLESVSKAWVFHALHESHEVMWIVYTSVCDNFDYFISPEDLINTATSNLGHKKS